MATLGITLVRLGVHGLDTPDPATSLITSHLTLNLSSGGFPMPAANGYRSNDVNKFADLATRPHPIGLLSQATGGQSERSLRWREMLRAQRLRRRAPDRLRRRGGCWGR